LRSGFDDGIVVVQGPSSADFSISVVAGLSDFAMPLRLIPGLNIATAV
jgi:hypothetical protein